jgi:outer membrane biosynthesis protein TonB
MKRSTFVLAAAAMGVMALSACDDRPSRSDDDYREAPVETTPPPAPVEQPAPPPQVEDPTPTPPPSTTLPPEERTSEQSVQPESETLFY